MNSMFYKPELYDIIHGIRCLYKAHEPERLMHAVGVYEQKGEVPFGAIIRVCNSMLNVHSSRNTSDNNISKSRYPFGIILFEKGNFHPRFLIKDHPIYMYDISGRFFTICKDYAYSLLNDMVDSRILVKHKEFGTDFRYMLDLVVKGGQYKIGMSDNGDRNIREYARIEEVDAFRRSAPQAKEADVRDFYMSLFSHIKPIEKCDIYPNDFDTNDADGVEREPETVPEILPYASMSYGGEATVLRGREFLEIYRKGYDM